MRIEHAAGRTKLSRSWLFGRIAALFAGLCREAGLVIIRIYRFIVRFAGVVQAVAALGAVYVAYYTLAQTATQLNGTTIYNVAKDGKALQRRFQNGEATPDEVMSYFFSVYTLHENGVLNDRTWKPIEIALCSFVKSGANVQQAWEKYRDNYDPNFRELVEDLRGRSKCE
jgi:hypothetical protein